MGSTCGKPTRQPCAFEGIDGTAWAAGRAAAAALSSARYAAGAAHAALLAASEERVVERPKLAAVIDIMHSEVARWLDSVADGSPVVVLQQGKSQPALSEVSAV